MFLLKENKASVQYLCKNFIKKIRPFFIILRKVYHENFCKAVDNSALPKPET
jgi:hypothetical protein